MARPKYIVTVPRKGSRKQITSISVKDDKELARVMSKAAKAGISASFQKLK
jgi:hypothetical protein